MSKLLELYNTWSRPGKKGNTTPIGSAGNYINGRENTAGGQAAVDFIKMADKLGGAEIPGFITNQQKGDPTNYPVDNEKAMEIARTQETGGTYDFEPFDWNNTYSKSFVRE